jgi:CheY-like chemotaxis protein
LRQVLLNLLANAVKFTDRGQVQLRVGFMLPSRLLFEVSDTGIGIDAEQLEGIFHPYEQAQHGFGGTGLGLAISRQFVRLMGGEIQVESRVGQGSRFWFEVDLPLVAAEAVEPVMAERNITGYEGQRRTVLVVDDVPENRAVLVDMLGPLGFVMAEAVTGSDALTRAPAVKPDLVLMDVVLPDIDGLETSRRLRRLQGLEAVPIIAVSASAFGDDEARCLAAGLNAFLPKPIEFEQLLEQITVQLGLHWCYAPVRQTSSQESLRSDQLEAPPPDEMDVLCKLARLGNMQDILERADYLNELDERYRPFAEQLRRMASNFQSKAISGFIDLHMKNQQERTTAG